MFINKMAFKDYNQFSKFKYQNKVYNFKLNSQFKAYYKEVCSQQKTKTPLS